MTSRRTHRVRKFTREIMLASAITIAAIAMLFASREQTEIAVAPSAATGPAGNAH